MIIYGVFIFIMNPIFESDTNKAINQFRVKVIVVSQNLR